MKTRREREWPENNTRSRVIHYSNRRESKSRFLFSFSFVLHARFMLLAWRVQELKAKANETNYVMSRCIPPSLLSFFSLFDEEKLSAFRLEDAQPSVLSGKYALATCE